MESIAWVLTFEEVMPEDLQLLGATLIGTFGLAALPTLERRFAMSSTSNAH